MFQQSLLALVVSASIASAQVTVDFTSDKTAGLAPLTVTFESHVVGGDVASWAWDTGSGISSLPAPTIVFEHPGFYSVTLTVGVGDDNVAVTKPSLIHVIEDGVCPQTAVFHDPNAVAAEGFGEDLALDEGRVLVVSAGGRRALVLDSQSGALLQELSVSVAHRIVSLDIDGDLAVLGAPDAPGGGVVFVFDVASGDELAVLRAPFGDDAEAFGTAVSLRDELVLVGAPEPLASDQTLAYLFDLAEPSSPALVSVLEPAFPTAGFGEGVALGAARAVVGAQLTSDFGVSFASATVFDVSVPESPLFITRISSPSVAAASYGRAVAISDDVIAVGAPTAGNGAVYVYDADDGSFMRGFEEVGEAFLARLGSSVAAAGSRVLVGASGDTHDFAATGAAYVFDAESGEQLARWTAFEGTGGDAFGACVAWDGAAAFVSAPRDDSVGVDAGAVYAFDVQAQAWIELGGGVGGAGEVPTLQCEGLLSPRCSVNMVVSGDVPNTPTVVVVGLANVSVPFLGGVLVPSLDAQIPFTTDATGDVVFTTELPSGFPLDVPLFFQCWLVDPSAPHGYAATNAVEGAVTD